MDIGIPEPIVRPLFECALKNECLLELKLPIRGLSAKDIDSIGIRTAYVVGARRPDVEHEHIIPKYLNGPYVWEPVSGHFFNEDSDGCLMLCFSCPNGLRDSLNSECESVEELSGICAIGSELYVEINSNGSQIAKSFIYNLLPGRFECCDTTKSIKEAAKMITLDSSCPMDWNQNPFSSSCVGMS